MFTSITQSKKWLYIYLSGASRYIPELNLLGQLCIKKLDCVSYVDELTVTSNRTFSDKERIIYEKQVKAYLYSSFPLGAPFTVHVGCKIHLPSFNKNDNTFTVQGYRLSESFYDNELANHGFNQEQQGEDMERSVTIPSQLLTIDECEGSLSSVTDGVSKLQVTSPFPSKCGKLEETRNDSKLAANLFTSTPKKAVTLEESSHGRTFSMLNCKEISVIRGTALDTDAYILHRKTSPWVRTGRNTKVILQQVCNKKADLSLPKKIPEQNEYCKDSTYYTLKKIMETALSDSGITGMKKIISLITREIASDIGAIIMHVALMCFIPFIIIHIPSKHQ